MENLTLDIRVIGPGHDPELLAHRARNLHALLLAIDVEDVSPGPGEVLTVGAPLVTVAPHVVQALLSVAASWLSRQPGGIELEIDGRRIRGPVTRAQRDAMVAEYLRELPAASS